MTGKNELGIGDISSAAAYWDIDIQDEQACSSARDLPSIPLSRKTASITLTSIIEPQRLSWMNILLIAGRAL